MFLILGFATDVVEDLVSPWHRSLGRGIIVRCAVIASKESATCCCDVCGHSHLYQYLLCGYPKDDAYTGEYHFEGAYAYLLVTFYRYCCNFFYNLLSSIIRALGDSKTPLFLGTGYGAHYYSRFILYIGTGLVSDGAAIATVFSAGARFSLLRLYVS